MTVFLTQNIFTYINTMNQVLKNYGEIKNGFFLEFEHTSSYKQPCTFNLFLALFIYYENCIKTHYHKLILANPFLN